LVTVWANEIKEGREIKLQLHTLKKGIQDIEFCFPAPIAATLSPQKKIMNQITKYYIKRKLEKGVGQCGGIQGRQDHREREGETIL
jgi:hypothetical protein